MLLTANMVNFNNIIHYPNIEIESGQVTFICGDSGCGKSTLLKLLNGVVTPQTGEIMYNDKNIKDLDTVELRRNLLLVSQSIHLFDKTIEQNFVEFYSYRDLPAPTDEEIKSYLSICCTDFPIDMYCTSMSGGERQRVYIAIYLSFMPKVLMLDEPTSALDTQNAITMMQNIISYCKEKDITMIAVSHNKSLSKQFADKVITLEGRS